MKKTSMYTMFEPVPHRTKSVRVRLNGRRFGRYLIVDTRGIGLIYEVKSEPVPETILHVKPLHEEKLV